MAPVPIPKGMAAFAMVTFEEPLITPEKTELAFEALSGSPMAMVGLLLNVTLPVKVVALPIVKLPVILSALEIDCAALVARIPPPLIVIVPVPSGPVLLPAFELVAILSIPLLRVVPPV